MLKKIKEQVKIYFYDKLGIAYNSCGIPFPLFKYIREFKNISLIDIGAHNGSFARSIEEHCGISRAILIEPLPHKVTALKKIFNPRIYSIVPYVASSEVGTVDFEINDFEPTSSMLKINRDMPELADINLGVPKHIKCIAKPLDVIVKEFQLNEIDLVKIDVQGAEHLVLRGAEESLKLAKMIWIEVSFKPLYEDSSNFTDIYHLLYKSNFHLVELEPGFRAPTGELLQGDALFIKDETS